MIYKTSEILKISSELLLFFYSISKILRCWDKKNDRNDEKKDKSPLNYVYSLCSLQIKEVLNDVYNV